MSDEREENLDSNLDPITHEPGAHPVGTGVGATLGGVAAGAALGAAGGPFGAALGGVAGAVVGGLGGKAAAEAVNPTAEDAYWREAYTDEPYYDRSRTYDHYRPAYELGWSSVALYGGPFDAAEPRISAEWDKGRTAASLQWHEARPAVQAAYERASRVNETQPNPDDVLDVLGDLLESCRDGEYGFRASAEHAKSADIQTLLSRHAAECAAAAAELEREIKLRGGKPPKGGTAGGALHRGWVAVRSALTTQDDKAVLQECERGEDTAVARYRKALKAALPADLRAIIERQAQGAQRNHDEMKALRDAFKR